MNNWKKNKRKLLLSIVVCMFFLTACSGTKGGSEPELVVQSESTDALVYGGSESAGQSYSVSEYGMIYGKENNVTYYDFSTDEAYVLCDKANCAHLDDTCSAWYESPSDAVGFALYQENFYMFRKNTEKNTYEFVSMDITGNNQQVVATIDIGEYQSDSWVIQSLGTDVYYSGNMVWLSTNCTYISNGEEIGTCKQYLGINITNGKKVSLNELAIDNVEYSMKGITKKHIVLGKRWNNLEQLSEAEFMEAYKRGEFKDKIKDSVDLYYSYLEEWYPENSEEMDTYLSYDINTGEETIMEEKAAIKLYEADGTISATVPAYTFLGEYNGQLLCDEPDYELSNSNIFLWNLEENEKETILEIENGGTLLTESGSICASIFEESKFLYCRYNENEKADIYLFDIDTKQVGEPLFEDEANISFRIINDTSDFFIGKIYNATGYEVYKIQKDDYYNGNLEKAIKLEL